MSLSNPTTKKTESWMKDRRVEMKQLSTDVNTRWTQHQRSDNGILKMPASSLSLHQASAVSADSHRSHKILENRDKRPVEEAEVCTSIHAGLYPIVSATTSRSIPIGGRGRESSSNYNSDSIGNNDLTALHAAFSTENAHLQTILGPQLSKISQGNHLNDPMATEIGHEKRHTHHTLYKQTHYDEKGWQAQKLPMSPASLTLQSIAVWDSMTPTDDQVHLPRSTKSNQSSVSTCISYEQGSQAATFIDTDADGESDPYSSTWSNAASETTKQHHNVYPEERHQLQRWIYEIYNKNIAWPERFVKSQWEVPRREKL